MKKYNIITQRIEEAPTVITTSSGSFYTSKFSEQDFISNGYLPIIYGSTPNRRYYTYEEVVVQTDTSYSISYTPIARPIEEIKESMRADLKKTFELLAYRPIVDTGLGFFVDGNRSDLQNFELGKKYGLLNIKDADNIVRTLTSISEYDTIISAIEQYGLTLYSKKWEIEAIIGSFTTVSECILFEATPYEATVDVIDELTLLPTGATQIVTLYKNNVKEWF